MDINADHNKQKQVDELFRILATLHGEDELRAFFEDMCTEKEIEHMAGRVAGAGMLLDGETYNTIIACADISAATLSRVSRSMQYGSGGYRVLLKRYYDSIKKAEAGQDEND